MHGKELVHCVMRRHLDESLFESFRVIWPVCNRFQRRKILFLWLLFRNILQMDKVWPQHQQRLEMALLEEVKIARKISSDASNALQRKRSVFYEPPYFVKRNSLTLLPKVSAR